MSKRFFKRNKLQKNLYYLISKCMEDDIKTIHQLSCFVGHPERHEWFLNNIHNILGVFHFSFHFKIFPFPTFCSFFFSDNQLQFVFPTWYYRRCTEHINKFQTKFKFNHFHFLSLFSSFHLNFFIIPSNIFLHFFIVYSQTNNPKALQIYLWFWQLFNNL